MLTNYFHHNDLSQLLRKHHWKIRERLMEKQIGKIRRGTITVLLWAALGIVMSVTWLFAVGQTSATDASTSALAWNFDVEAIGTLPPEFQVETLYDGQPAGEWVILERKEALGSVDIHFIQMRAAAR